MKVIPRSTLVFTNAELTIIREAADPLASRAFTMCIKDLGGNLVYYREFSYDSLNEVQDVDVPVDAPLDGIYNMEIYGGIYAVNNCSRQDSLVARYPIHATLAAADVKFSDRWKGSGRWLAMWVHEGRLFWTCRSGTGIQLPLGVTAVIETTDDAGNAFAGTVTVTGPITLSPNLSVPFTARITLTLDQPQALSLVRALTDFGGLTYGATINALDDYTVEITIVKTGPGIWALVALALGIIAAICTWMLHDIRVKEIEVEARRLETVEPLIDRYSEILNKYMEEVSKAKSEEEVKSVQAKYFGALQTTSALIGQALTSGIGACNGIKIGNTCVPWWVVGIGMFAAGLVVAAVLK
jgi:hypothetical protein